MSPIIYVSYAHVPILNCTRYSFLSTCTSCIIIFLTLNLLCSLICPPCLFQCATDPMSPESLHNGVCSPSSKKAFKMPKRSKKPRNSSSSSSLSSSCKAKRSLFEDRQQLKESSTSTEDGGDYPDSVAEALVAERRTGRRQGSLLELQGKLGVP